MRLSPHASVVRQHLIAHVIAQADAPATAWLHTGPALDAQLAAAATPEQLATLTTTYESVWQLALGLDWQQDTGFRRIGKLLEQVGLYEHEHGRPHLTACCVQVNSGTPGAGFAGLLNRLPGRAPDHADSEDTWRRELIRLVRFWRVAAPAGSVRPGSPPTLTYDPTAIADAHYARLADRIRRTST